MGFSPVSYPRVPRIILLSHSGVLIPEIRKFLVAICGRGFHRWQTSRYWRQFPVLSVAPGRDSPREFRPARNAKFDGKSKQRVSQVSAAEVGRIRTRPVGGIDRVVQVFQLRWTRPENVKVPKSIAEIASVLGKFFSSLNTCKMK